MASDGYSSADRDRAKEEQLSSDDGLHDFGNQTHEFQDDADEEQDDADQQEVAPYLSEGSEYEPDDSDAVRSAQAADSEQPTSEDEREVARSRSPRKRRARSSLNVDVEQPPVKRAKGSYNRAYLDLLNDDIEDAAAQYTPDGDRVDLPPSQVGLTVWTSVEKEHFFEALGRLGRDNIPGIARRIRTKEEMEVRQYMKLLDDALTTRKRHNELSSLELADFPAAVELGVECDSTLEGAADSLARRQANHEEAVERRQWGDDFLLTADNHEEFQEDEEGALSGSITLFDLSTWLKLSERVFMNSPDEEGNWRSVASELPSFRLTALEDFYSLTLSMTKRLIVSALYFAESRIRSKRSLDPRKHIRNILKRRDMEAAIASLNLESNKSFWAKCPRRLGLRVYEEIPRLKDTDAEPIPYEEVEDALGLENDRHDSIGEWDGSSISSDSSLHESTKGEEDDVGEEASSSWEDEDEDEDVKDEAKEVMLHSAVDRPQTTRERQALLRRIKAEREQESFADALDARATYKEEKRLWRLLGQEPSQRLEKPVVPKAEQRMKFSVDDMYSAGHDWRQHLHYVSDWEPPSRVGSSGV